MKTAKAYADEREAYVLELVAENEQLRTLLPRCLSSVNCGAWRDHVGLSAEAHPVWDDVREALRPRDFANAEPANHATAETVGDEQGKHGGSVDEGYRHRRPNPHPIKARQR